MRHSPCHLASWCHDTCKLFSSCLTPGLCTSRSERLNFSEEEAVGGIGQENSHRYLSQHFTRDVKVVTSVHIKQNITLVFKSCYSELALMLAAVVNVFVSCIG